LRSKSKSIFNSNEARLRAKIKTPFLENDRVAKLFVKLKIDEDFIPYVQIQKEYMEFFNLELEGVITPGQEVGDFVFFWNCVMD